MTTIHPRVLETLRADTRSGHSTIISFDHPNGGGRLDVFGPEGMRGGNDDAFTEPVPTVRLWAPGIPEAPIAEAVANRAFPTELDRLAERARPFIDEEWSAFLIILATIREATAGLRFRVPKVGTRVQLIGTPSVEAWMSCLSLGDLQAAILRASNIRRVA